MACELDGVSIYKLHVRDRIILVQLNHHGMHINITKSLTGNNDKTFVISLTRPQAWYLIKQLHLIRQ